MKSFLKYFKVWFIIIGVMAVIYFCATVVRSATGRTYDEHDNSTTEQRVFDYADKLTDRQEEKLEALIEKREEQTGLHIVLVTLNEDLGEWVEENEEVIEAHDYDGYYYEQNMTDSIAYKNICIYSNVFYDEHKFGYDGYEEEDRYSGDGVLFVDNWYGTPQTWFCTSGKAVDFYEANYAAASWHVLDIVGDFVVINPYWAYTAYVNTIYYDQVGFLGFNGYVDWRLLFIVPLIAAVIFMVAKRLSVKAKDTTTAGTYVKGGRPTMNHQADIFVTKHVTQRRIESSSGGGGGRRGGGGGHSHGGHGGGH